MTLNSTSPEGLPADEPDPFDLFQSAGAVAAFIWNKAGEAGLRDLLGRDVNGKPLNREWIEGIASELQAVGMLRAAAIVSEIASQKPSELDVATYCPYPDDAGAYHSANVASWLRSTERSMKAAEAKRRK